MIQQLIYSSALLKISGIVSGTDERQRNPSAVSAQGYGKQFQVVLSPKQRKYTSVGY